MSATSDYQADVKRRGWIYLDQLPPQTGQKGNRAYIGAGAPGAPGARSPWSPNGSSYELAPTLVRIEQGVMRSIQAVEDQTSLAGLAAVETRDNALAGLAEATGLDHGVPGALAKIMGVQPWVMVVIILIVLYLALVQYRIVPSPKELTK